ncbi:hypothetical protein M440DRAFT_1107199 [Trichoderma longibrachiatum ATCC 18648]|uniref:Uncharacterized protein n=1 Tax=Trichoderma longibrachiatum ATCC 18648 TaxID=983965 RepID=A0A2T4CEF3_TRILO|nr:hypothetical protein M440DRAFT_1107199 [Trichoderma longibrachiatum ATCC 18648]
MAPGSLATPFGRASLFCFSFHFQGSSFPKSHCNLLHLNERESTTRHFVPSTSPASWYFLLGRQEHWPQTATTIRALPLSSSSSSASSSASPRPCDRFFFFCLPIRLRSACLSLVVTNNYSALAGVISRAC